MIHSLVLSYGAIPEAVLSVGYVICAAFLLCHRDMVRYDLLRPVVRFFVVGALFWGVYAGWLSQTNAHDAALWVRFFFPLALMAELAAIEVCLSVVSLKIPSWFVVLWGGALGALILVWLSPWLPVLSASPDGYFISFHHLPATFVAACLVFYGGGVLALLTLIIVRGIRQGVMRRYGLWFGLGLLWLFLEWHDGIYASGHHTLYPSTWIVGLLLGIFIVYRSRLTPVSTSHPAKILTPYEGWEYGVQHLSQASVGLLYAVMRDYVQVQSLYGERLAEQMVHRLGEELVHMCRHADRVVQWPDGQFLLVFPFVTYSGQQMVRERVTPRIQQLRFHDPGSGQMVTVAIEWGWAWAERGADFDALVKVAQRAGSPGQSYVGSH